MANAKQTLEAKISDRSARIGVIGMGYVGLPLSLTFVQAGFRVTGFDIDAAKVKALNAGRSYIQHIDADAISEGVSNGRLEATSDFDQLDRQDAVLICVPTPLTKQREPEMRYVRDTAIAVSARLRSGQLIVLESTTYPGTTDELVRGILEQREHSLDQDFFLAFSPEREDPGNARFSTRNIPKLVGGVSEASGEVAEKLYAAALEHVIRVADARTAEAAKLTENIFRGVNIALVNELKIAFDRMGIDIWNVLDAASTKPFGFMRFNPGPGWGGHCIPIDPFYMSWKAREYDVTTNFIEHAGEVNVQMPGYVVGKLQNALNDRGKPVKGSRVLLLGVAYKNDIDDCRESPVFPIIERLSELGAHIAFHDPHVHALPRTRAWPHLHNLPSDPLTPILVSESDAILIVTAHTAVDYEMVEQHAQLIVDTRGVYRLPNEKVVRA